MQYQLFVTVVVAIVGCVVVAGQESEQEAALWAALPRINQWNSQDMALMLRTMNRNKVTLESSEEEIASALTSYLFSGDAGVKYTEEIHAGRKPSTAFDLVFVSAVVVPCEQVIEHVGGHVNEIEKAGVATTQVRTDTWIAVTKYCQKFLDNAHHWSELSYKLAEERNLL